MFYGEPLQSLETTVSPTFSLHRTKRFVRREGVFACKIQSPSLSTSVRYSYVHSPLWVVNRKECLVMKSVLSCLLVISTIFLALEVNAEVSQSGALLIMKKPANTCGAEGSRFLCRSSALIRANVYVRELYNSTVRLATTNEHGVLSVRLKPGRYEIGLSGRYAYGVMNNAFGMKPCNRNTATNGGYSCPEQSGCFPVTTFPLTYPPRYRESEDPQLTSYTDAEAPVFVHVKKSTKRISLTYQQRCI